LPRCLATLVHGTLVHTSGELDFALEMV
jgi:hypothetical protein